MQTTLPLLTMSPALKQETHYTTTKKPALREVHFELTQVGSKEAVNDAFLHLPRTVQRRIYRKALAA